MSRFAGKIVLVTGASRGIGRAVATRLAGEGAHIALNHWRDGEEAAETVTFLQGVSAAAGFVTARHQAFDVDVADTGAARGMVTRILADFGRLDILINNAGILPPEAPGAKFDAADFDRVLAVNLRAAANLCARAIEHFLQRGGGGVIVNTTSVHELIPKPGYLPYAIANSGVGMLTRTLGLEYADKGIRVNAVGPGAVDTDMNNAWIDDPAARSAVEKHIPMGRTAKPGDIAGVYAFLASADAAYITGQTIYACGGLTLFGDFKRNWSS